MMSASNIAIIGATGVVGQAILALLEEREFPVESLTLIAGEEGVGQTHRFKGKTVSITALSNTNWSEIQLVFLATRASPALEQSIAIAQEGAIVIDCGGFFANSYEIPLILPGINDGEISDFRQTNIVALPSPIVTQMLKTALAVTHADNIRRLDVTTYLSASFYGKTKIEVLAAQTARLLNGLGIEGNQIAFNLEPARRAALQDDALILQCRRILNNDRLEVSLNATNVPVFYGLAQNVNVTTEYPIDIEQFKESPCTQPDISFISEAERLSLMEITDMPATLVIGDLHVASGIPDMLHVWSHSDNVRYLGALMAIQLAERLIHADY